MALVTENLDDYVVVDAGDDEPLLYWKDGREVDTWKRGTPTTSACPGRSTRSRSASSRSSC